jgi:general secretion pathway protein L
MSELLVIRLDAGGAGTAQWVAVDATGAVSGATGAGLLADAAPAAAGRSVTVLVPARDVLRTRADVPLKGGAKLQQALPFALEEQLAEDIDVLHFAAGARGEDGRLDVAAVRRDTLAGWLAALEAAGIVPQRVCSEADAVAPMPNTATLAVQEDAAVLVEPDGTSTAMDADAVEGVLALWLARRPAAGDPEAVPLHLVAYGSPGALAPLEPVWDELRPRVETLDVRVLAEGLLPRLAAQAATAPGVNLLQGAYARRSGVGAWWPAWRVAAALLAAFALLATAAALLELRALRREVAALDATIDQAFHYVFPDAGPIQDARAQLSSQLQLLGGQGGGASHEFLDTLRAVAQALSANGGARVEAVSYRTGTMELRLRAPNVEALDRIQQLVSQSGGLEAQIQSANAAGEEVVGRLQITRQGGA